MNDEGQPRVGLGIPSMVLILLVLCLVLIGLLTLMSARAAVSQSERYAELTTCYYEAAAAAQRAMAALDEQMAREAEDCESAAAYRRAVRRIDEADGAQIEWTDEDTAVMTFDAGYDRALVVELAMVGWADAQQQRFCVVRHALEDASDWVESESLILMGL